MKRNLLSMIIALLVFVSGFSQNKQKQITKEAKNNKEVVTSNGNLTTKQVKKLRKKHEYYLANHPFKKVFDLSKTERKSEGIPPNKYNEQEWILTMDPALGKPTPEVLEGIRQELNKKRNSILENGRVPGDATSSWIERGPNNVGGRTRAIIFDPTDVTTTPYSTVIAGSVSGGLWKNTDITSAASTWTRMSLPSNLNVQSIAVDPNNNQIWYVATGESYAGGDVNGQGLWKTTNAGTSWTQVYGGGAINVTQNNVFNFTVNSAPSNPSLVRGYVTGTASWAGGKVTGTLANKQVVLMVDNAAPTDDGCSAPAAGQNYTDKIVLIRRGTCSFESKSVNAALQNAVAVIIMNNAAGAGAAGMAEDAAVTGTIPTLMVSKEDGDALEAALGGGINATIGLPGIGEFNGNDVSGIIFINDVVVKNNAGTSEVYIAAGDGYYQDAFNNSIFNATGFGLYKSTNGGSTWSSVALPASPSGNKTCPNDIELAINGDIWVSSTDSFTFDDGGGKVFRSQNNGASFTLMHTVTGYTSGTLGTGGTCKRTEIETSGTNANTVYVLAQIADMSPAAVTTRAWETRLIKTTDAFATAPTQITLPTSAYSASSPTKTREYVSGFTGYQAFWNLMLEADPTNDAIIYIGGIDLYRSANSGGSWTQISHWASANDVHSDQHALTFKPGTGGNNVGVFGNDGGVYYCGSLSTANNTVGDILSRNAGFITTQFVGVAVRPIRSGTTGDFFIAGAQDNGSQYLPSSLSATTGATVVAGSTRVQSGDGGKPLFYQGPAGTDYYVSQYVYNDNINTRNLDGTINTILSDGTPNLGLFYPAICLDSSNNIVYSEALDKTTSPVTWQIRRYSNIISGSATITPLTDPLLNYYATALTTGKTTPTTLYVGTANSKLLKVTNAHNTTGTWSSIGGASFIGSISDVEFGANENQIFVTMHNYSVNNIWYSPNGGTNWYQLDGNLPNLPVKTIIQNPNRPEELLIGTELGTWTTNGFNPASTGDQALTWVQSFNGMQDVKVTDLDIQRSDVSPSTFNVFAATYGRGVFSGPLEAALSTNEHEIASTSVNVYPTVSNGNVTISADKSYGKTTLELFDITGKSVYTNTIELDANANQVNFGTLSTGNYILKLSGDNFKTTKRLIIQ